MFDDFSGLWHIQSSGYNISGFINLLSDEFCTFEKMHLKFSLLQVVPSASQNFVGTLQNGRMPFLAPGQLFVAGTSKEKLETGAVRSHNVSRSVTFPSRA